MSYGTCIAEFPHWVEQDQRQAGIASINTTNLKYKKKNAKLMSYT